MIEAAALRIGNWIEYDGERIQVKALSADGCFADHQAGNDEWIWIELSYCTPIPLTPELLEKAGLGSGSRFFIFLSPITLTLIFSGGELALIDNDETFTESLPHIRHLHQLQNLVHDLSGNELEIKEL